MGSTIVDLLSQGPGVGIDGVRQNGLQRLAGTWSEEEHAAFEKATAPFEKVDEELWR